MQKIFKYALEVVVAAVIATVFCLFAFALFAVFVRAFSLNRTAILIVNWVLKSVAVFLSALFFVKGERALFKGLFSGAAAALLMLLLFGILGGFHMTPVFLIELLLLTLLGGLGAFCSVKFRKE